MGFQGGGEVEEGAMPGFTDEGVEFLDVVGEWDAYAKGT